MRYVDVNYVIGIKHPYFYDDRGRGIIFHISKYILIGIVLKTVGP